MAFIDWLRKQQEESERNRRLFENRPGTLRAGEVPTHEMVRASRAWGGGPGSGSGYQDREGGQNLMVRQPRFGRPPPDSVTLTEKDDGTSTRVTKWDKQLKATALPPEPVMGPGRELPPERANPMWSAKPLNPLHWGRQNPNVPGSMGRDPGWAGVPRARPQPSIANIGVPPHVPRMRGDIGVADSIGMPQVANLRNRVREIGRQQAAIPRQQMPPPRFVPPVDWRSFPQVQDRNTGTYNLGDPGVQMSGGFDWTGRALRENVGEDLRNVWNPIGDRVKKMLEDIPVSYTHLTLPTILRV